MKREGTEAGKVAARPVARRSQAERTSATRAALADAAIEVLIEHGWASVTVIAVCDRAGVTRGAFHHHYTSVSSLVAHALQRSYAEIRAQAAPAPSCLVDLIDACWAATSNPRFKAVIEAWLAMANDPALGVELGPVVAEFATLVRPDAAAATIITNEERRTFYLMAREAMLGLTLGRATNGGRPVEHEQAVLGRLRAEAAAYDARAK